MFSINYKRNRHHRNRDRMDTRYQPTKRETRWKRVSENDEKLMYAMWKQGYLKSEIGKEFGVCGKTAGRHIRAYQKKLEGSR